MHNSKKRGSKPIRGNISDNKLSLILGIPKSTLKDWSNSNNYRAKLYWFLKSMHERDIQMYESRSKVISAIHKKII